MKSSWAANMAAVQEYVIQKKAFNWQLFYHSGTLQGPPFAQGNATACTKWFRHRTVKRVLAYETLSETDFGIDPRDAQFKPNLFVNISDYLEQKLQLMRVYSSELGEFPFPRSEKSLRALAQIRGAQAGCEAAEAFMSLRVLE